MHASSCTGLRADKRCGCPGLVGARSIFARLGSGRLFKESGLSAGWGTWTGFGFSHGRSIYWTSDEAVGPDWSPSTSISPRPRLRRKLVTARSLLGDLTPSLFPLYELGHLGECPEPARQTRTRAG